MNQVYMNVENADTLSSRLIKHTLWEHIPLKQGISNVRSAIKNRGVLEILLKKVKSYEEK